jgi:ubiquinone/menaquinone biosynthesis C-methylase UbiE
MRTVVTESTRRRAAEIAYEAVAAVYDDFTAHHDYPLWLGNFLPKLEVHGLQKGKLLDVACGTGKSFLWMLKGGWEVTACDLSPSMLEQARAKIGTEVSLSVADMRALPRFGQFDLVWALDDAVNYMLSGDELVAALTGMRRNLAPNGLLMFDLNTLHAYRTFFAETQIVEKGGRKLVWEGSAPPDVGPGRICEARFHAEPSDGPHGSVAPHVHLQRHFPAAEALAAIESAGLACLDVYGHGHDAVPQQPLDELVHHKAVFICQTS